MQNTVATELGRCPTPEGARAVVCCLERPPFLYDAQARGREVILYTSEPPLTAEIVALRAFVATWSAAETARHWNSET